MALIKCPECGNQVSDKASACPNCGCPLDCCMEAGSISQVEGQNQPPAIEPLTDNPVSLDGTENEGSNSNAKRDRKIRSILIAIGLYLAATIGFFALAVFGQMVTGSDLLVNMGVGATGLLIIGAIPYLVATLVFHLVLKGERRERIIGAVRGRTARAIGSALIIVFLGVSYLIGGSPLACSHDNAPSPTCTEASICPDCGTTLAGALGHKTKEWSAPSINVATAEETSTLKCEACGEIVDQKTTAVKSLIKDGKFIFSPSDFCKRLRDKAGMEAIDGGDAQLISYALVESMSNRQMCAMLSFTTMDGQTNLGDSYKYDSSCNPSPVFIVDTEKCNSAEMMVGFVMTCDPALSRSEAAEVAKALAGSVSGSNGSTEKNGITYLLAGIDERIMFRAVVS